MTSPEARAATDHLLSSTRAVRKRFDFDRPVEPEVLLECVALAQQAPTGGNSQGWRFVIVTDPAKRHALAEMYREGGGTYLAKSAETATDAQDQRVYNSAMYLADNLERVPVHVIPCIYGTVSPTAHTTAAVAGLYGSIIPATWSFMLALRSRGLGSVWTTLHLRREQAAADLLGIPAGVTQAGLIPVGYYTGTDFKPVPRPPAAEITYWDGWEGK